MNNISLSPILIELERIYNELFKVYNLKCPNPIITIQTKGRGNCLGWHSSERWENNKEKITEINICAEVLNKNPVETLVHEMVHHANHCDKIEDCSSTQYHNKEFRNRAEQFGLKCDKSLRFGWGITSIDEKLLNILKDIKVNYDIFKIFRTEDLHIPAKTKMKKYRCSCTTVRCAVELQAKCLKCGNDFELKEE